MARDIRAVGSADSRFDEVSGQFDPRARLSTCSVIDAKEYLPEFIQGFNGLEQGVASKDSRFRREGARSAARENARRPLVYGRFVP
jgi:hypothetical protein